MAGSEMRTMLPSTAAMKAPSVVLESAIHLYSSRRTSAHPLVTPKARESKFPPKSHCGLNHLTVQWRVDRWPFEIGGRSAGYAKRPPGLRRLQGRIRRGQGRCGDSGRRRFIRIRVLVAVHVGAPAQKGGQASDPRHGGRDEEG